MLIIHLRKWKYWNQQLRENYNRLNKTVRAPKYILGIGSELNGDDAAEFGHTPIIDRLHSLSSCSPSLPFRAVRYQKTYRCTASIHA